MGWPVRETSYLFFDATYLLNHLFLGGLAPVPQNPACGLPPVDEEPSCEKQPASCQE